MFSLTGFLHLLQAAIKKGLEEFIGGLAFLLLVASLIAAYSHALGVRLW